VPHALLLELRLQHAPGAALARAAAAAGIAVSHGRVLERHEIEHVAAEVWELNERDRATVEELRLGSRVDRPEEVLERMERDCLLVVEDGVVRLTEAGHRLAELQVRRHRLAELLLQSVLEVPAGQTAERTACVMEHILSPTVTDSVCAFLGHPKYCPHGKPIPQGSCCRSFSDRVVPLVQPLTGLAVGRAARIVHVVPRHAERMVRLSTLGVVPGATLRLQQLRPAVVIQLGETVLALDREMAVEIYVKALD
jgi:DtxR family Mn-dependent transcriptional regulator